MKYRIIIESESIRSFVLLMYILMEFHRALDVVFTLQVKRGYASHTCGRVVTSFRLLKYLNEYEISMLTSG